MDSARDIAAATDGFARRVDLDRLRSRIAGLPAPRSRIHHPHRMDVAAALIAGWFAEAGLAVRRHEFRREDVVGHRDFAPDGRVTYPRLDGVNVVGTQAGRTDRAVVVVAHYDTVRDSPGANDNTAAVVALAEVARLLAGRTPRDSLILAATDLEEPGFFGADELAVQLTSRYRLRLVVNLECVAYTDPEPGSQRLPKGLALAFPRQVRRINRRGRRADFMVLLHNGPAASSTRLLRRAFAARCGPAAPVMLRDPNGLPVVGGWIRRRVGAARHFRRSDHVPFWDRGVPAVQITDTADLRYPHYHLPTDTVERLDFDRLRDVIAGTAAVVAHLCGHRP